MGPWEWWKWKWEDEEARVRLVQSGVVLWERAGLWAVVSRQTLMLSLPLCAA